MSVESEVIRLAGLVGQLRESLAAKDLEIERLKEESRSRLSLIGIVACECDAKDAENMRLTATLNGFRYDMAQLSIERDEWRAQAEALRSVAVKARDAIWECEADTDGTPTSIFFGALAGEIDAAISAQEPPK